MRKQCTDRDFIPPAIMSPGDRDKCSRFALSFFTSLKAARKRYVLLKQRMDVSHLGDHIGMVNVSESDGLMSKPSASGHMDLYEYVESDVANGTVEYYPIEEVSN